MCILRIIAVAWDEKASVTVELGDDGEKMARVNAYTGGIYFSETTKAKATLICFEECMERLIRVSGIVVSTGALWAGTLHSAVSMEGAGEWMGRVGGNGSQTSTSSIAGVQTSTAACCASPTHHNAGKLMAAGSTRWMFTENLLQRLLKL